MPFSKLANAIGASVTLKLNAEAARMRAAGDPVVHLGGGEPKSLAPDSAVAAGIDMLKTGEIRYTPAAGTPAMRDAIIAYHSQFVVPEKNRRVVEWIGAANTYFGSRIGTAAAEPFFTHEPIGLTGLDTLTGV